MSKEDKLLVDTTKEYLIGSITTKDRSNTYSKYIKRITKKYFGFEVIENDFRKLIERELFQSLSITDEWVQTYKKLQEETAKRGHTLQSVIDFYVQISSK